MIISTSGNTLSLRNTAFSNLQALADFEKTSEFVGKSSIEEHQTLIDDPDCLHLSIILNSDNRLIGHVLLSGILSKNKSLEFRRIFISEKGKGYGREAIHLIKKLCFEELKFHRLWLDVHTDNSTAICLYESEGFQPEGILRDAILTPKGFKSLKIYSILESEYSK